MKMKLYWYEFKISIFNIIMKIEMWSFFSLCDCHNVCNNKKATGMAEYSANFCIFFWLLH